MAKISSTPKTVVKKATSKKAVEKKTTTKKSASIKSTSQASKIKKAKQTSTKNVELLHDAIIEAIQDRKANNIISLNLTSIEDSVADYFIICSGDVNTHIKSIADNAEEDVRKKTGEKPWHAEGFENLEWVIVDYVNVVLHIFKKDIRDFYRLEDLWSDAERKEFN